MPYDCVGLRKRRECEEDEVDDRLGTFLSRLGDPVPKDDSFAHRCEVFAVGCNKDPALRLRRGPFAFEELPG